MVRIPRMALIGSFRDGTCDSCVVVAVLVELLLCLWELLNQLLPETHSFPFSAGLMVSHRWVGTIPFRS